MMIISQWLHTATAQLRQVGIASARLDAEVIAAHTLKHPRTWLHAHGDEPVDAIQHDILDARLDLRLNRVPIAYIIGHKEFYGRRFRVTTSTLIPRPESEDCIDVLATCIPQNLSLLQTPQRLVDVGTGSGCLGITAKLEHPELEVTLLDIDPHALRVAEKNAQLLGATVQAQQSNLLEQYPFVANYVIANLPYVDRSWDRSPETNHEPARALFADNDGLQLIYQLIAQLPQKLAPHGIVLLEADPCQHEAIKHYGAQYALHHHMTRGYCIALQKD